MSITDRTPEVVNIQLVERIGFNFPLHSEYTWTVVNVLVFKQILKLKWLNPGNKQTFMTSLLFVSYERWLKFSLFCV